MKKYISLVMILCITMLSAQEFSIDLVKNMKPRNIGPGGMSGRVTAIDVVHSDPDIMYVGMGEPQMRNNVSWGDGVYKTIDGGETWTHLGLEETHHISQIRVHPTNPDIVYVGAFGHAFGPNPERGVFKTIDGRR